jgi:hypothetical protein
MLWFDTSVVPAVLRLRNPSDEAWEELLDGGSY